VELPPEVVRLLGLQDGVITRRQALAAGLTKDDIARLVRRREWVRLLRGVYINHTGQPTWLQRAWAGVLAHAPAALAGTSPMPRPAQSGPIWVAVSVGRNVRQRPGYRVRYLTRFDEQVQHHTYPSRMRLEEACLELVVDTASLLDRIQLVAGVCQSRRTTALRLLAALAFRPRMPGRRWLEDVLRDIANGTCSVLEHGYLTKVERAHGLPPGRRQQVGEDTSGRVYRDVHYAQYDQYVELDGALFHDSPRARDADMERDLDAATEGQHAVRLGWGQVYGRPCLTAAKVATLLRVRGWTGTIRPCGPECAAA
jgi:hypothetical protein